MAVHDVEVDHPRAGVHHLVDLRAEPREVGREDRRRDPRRRSARSARSRRSRVAHIGLSIESPQCLALHVLGVCSCGRSSGARRSWGTARRVRSGADSTRSGSGPAAGSGAARARRSPGRRPGCSVAASPAALAARSSPNHRRFRRAMKNPVVRSRSGRSCRQRGSSGEASSGRGRRGPRARAPAAPRRRRREQRRDPVLVLAAGDRAGRVDERRRRGAAPRGRARRIRVLDLGQPLDRLRRLAPAGVGARGEGAEVRAGRVEQDPVEAGRHRRSPPRRPRSR